MGHDRRSPSWPANLVSDHMEKLVVFIVILQELLGERLAVVKEGSARRSVLGIVETGEARSGWREGRGSNCFRPDGDDLSGWSTPLGSRRVTNGHTTGVHEELKLPTAQRTNPIEPLNASCDASRVDGAWRKTPWREGHASPGRATQRLLHRPGGCVQRGEVRFQHGLELDDGRCGVGGKKRACQEGDGMGQGDSEVGGRHVRCMEKVEVGSWIGYEGYRPAIEGLEIEGASVCEGYVKRVLAERESAGYYAQNKLVSKTKASAEQTSTTAGLSRWAAELAKSFKNAELTGWVGTEDGTGANGCRGPEPAV